MSLTITQHIASARTVEEAAHGLLFHGTLETLEGPLHGGGYDGIFWTAEDSPLTAQCYIPTSGCQTLISFQDFFLDNPLRPNRNCALVDLVEDVLGIPRPEDVEYDRLGGAISWPIPEGWPLQGDVKRILEEDYGYHFINNAAWVKTRFESEREVIMPADWKREGTLVVAKPLEDLRIYDLASQEEADLSAPHYHNLPLFDRLIKAGYDAVRIWDWAQTERHGNVGHLSLGLLPQGLRKIDWFTLPAWHDEWDDDLTERPTAEFHSLWEGLRRQAA